MEGVGLLKHCSRPELNSRSIAWGVKAMTSRGVLVLGEEKLVIKDLTLCLGHMGYQLVGAPSTVEEAIRIMQDARPEVVLVNISPKGDFNALEAGDSIVRSFRIPVVFLTTHRDEPLIGESKATGSFGYLEKPFSQKRLRGVLEDVLAPNRGDSSGYHHANPAMRGNTLCHAEEPCED